MRFLRSFALVLALALLILPAAPLGGIVPIPTVGGEAMADQASCHASVGIDLAGPNYGVISYVTTDGGCDPDPRNANPIPEPKRCDAAAVTVMIVAGGIARAAGLTPAGWVAFGVAAAAGAYMTMGGCD